MRVLGSALIIASLVLGSGGIAFRLAGDARASESAASETSETAPQSTPRHEDQVCVPREPARLRIDLSRLSDREGGEEVVPLNTRGYNYAPGTAFQAPIPSRKRPPPASPERSQE
jgi:hypothetical protein